MGMEVDRAAPLIIFQPKPSTLVMKCNYKRWGRIVKGKFPYQIQSKAIPKSLQRYSIKNSRRLENPAALNPVII
jgi:hypothetical protein